MRLGGTLVTSPDSQTLIVSQSRAWSLFALLLGSALCGFGSWIVVTNNLDPTWILLAAVVPFFSALRHFKILGRGEQLVLDVRAGTIVRNDQHVANVTDVARVCLLGIEDAEGSVSSGVVQIILKEGRRIDVAKSYHLVVLESLAGKVAGFLKVEAVEITANGTIRREI
jgi:hypothetical protein